MTNFSSGSSSAQWAMVGGPAWGRSGFSSHRQLAELWSLTDRAGRCERGACGCGDELSPDSRPGAQTTPKEGSTARAPARILSCRAPHTPGGGVAFSKHCMSLDGQADLGLLCCLVRPAKLRASGSLSIGDKEVLTEEKRRAHTGPGSDKRRSHPGLHPCSSQQLQRTSLTHHRWAHLGKAGPAPEPP